MPIGAPSAQVRARAKAHNIPIRASLAAWYRYHRGITNIGGACSSWYDYSGNQRPLLQATASKRPVINSDGSLTFDGSDDTMAATFTLSQALTIYIAFMQLAWTSGDVILDGVTAAVQLAQNTSSPGIAANAGSGLTVSNTAIINGRAVACFVANGASSVYQVGGGAASVTTSGNAGANNAGGLTLGSDAAGANAANVRIFEVVAFSAAHAAADRLQMLRYMARVAQVGGV